MSVRKQRRSKGVWRLVVPKTLAHRGKVNVALVPFKKESGRPQLTSYLMQEDRMPLP